MSPSALDLFVLTFNCAKNLINVAVFASHLQVALSQNATRLPDLVVFSLQEVAPLSYSFIGSYFLNPYYSRFEDALNVAAVKLLTASEPPVRGDERVSAQTAGSQDRDRPSRPYTLVRAKNVGMTAIILFARTPAALHHIEEAECGFGAADMGNKGAVGLRVRWSGRGSITAGPGADGDGESDDEWRTTELTFVATHLAAMEWNLKKRNANWRSIASSLTFENPKKAIPGLFPASPGPPKPSEVDTASDGDGRDGSLDSAADAEDVVDGEEGDQPLLGRGSPANGSRLHPDHPDLTLEHQAALQEVSVFKPTAHLFVAGDLNYRISSTTPPALSTFPSFDTDSPDHHSAFLSRDQLSQERAAGRAFNGLSEADISFGPSYKYDVLQSADGAVNEEAARRGSEVPWRWAPHRWPSWCDRILYLDVPSWVKRRQAVSGRGAGMGGDGSQQAQAMDVKAYGLLPVVRTSDHRPVFLRVGVPVLSAEEMTPPASQSTGSQGEAAAGTETLLEEDLADPRAVLPVPIDVHAWERRAAVRRREMMVGWTMFLWSTREGAVLIATTLLVGIGGWWLWRLW